MIDIQAATINTAGAYVLVHELYAFALGSKLNQGRIPVFRLGGHREENETCWQCAVREVYEEVGIRIQLLTPPTTFLADGDHLETDLQVIRWVHASNSEAIPYLVVAYLREGKTRLSLMYLARAKQLPIPSSEVQGVLLLDREKIDWLCSGPRTLKQYLNHGGKAILNGDFDCNLILEPFTQLRLLSKILKGYHDDRSAFAVPN